MVTRFRAQAKSEARLEKLSNRAKSGLDHLPPNPPHTNISFSTYGSHDERIAVVVKNQDTGEVICEFPSKEMQKLHVDMLI
jgi:uncharacterized FlaG/YvyC family protein